MSRADKLALVDDMELWATKSRKSVVQFNVKQLCAWLREAWAREDELNAIKYGPRDIPIEHGESARPLTASAVRQTESCRSCGASIVWARTVGGKSIPLDNEPVANGNIRPVSHGATLTVEVVGAGEGQYVSHFATCADASRWRRPQRKRSTSGRTD